MKVFVSKTRDNETKQVTDITYVDYALKGNLIIEQTKKGVRTSNVSVSAARTEAEGLIRALNWSTSPLYKWAKRRTGGT